MRSEAELEREALYDLCVEHLPTCVEVNFEVSNEVLARGLTMLSCIRKGMKRKFSELDTLFESQLSIHVQIRSDVTSAIETFYVVIKYSCKTVSGEDGEISVLGVCTVSLLHKDDTADMSLGFNPLMDILNKK